MRTLWCVPELFGGSMRKILSVLLVAILAASTAFATFSGEASIGFGGNLDNGNFGFIDKAAKVKFDVDLATADAEAIANGDVYASIKATLGVKVLTGEKKYGAGDPYDDKMEFGIIADITEAKVAGADWYVSILGMPGGPDYAKSAIDTYTVEDNWDKWGLPREDYDKNATYSASYSKTNGVEVGVYDYKLGFGLLGDYSKADTWKLKDNLNFTLYAETPEYDFDGVTVKAGTVYTYKTIDKLSNGVPTYVENKVNSLGASAKVGYVSGAFSTSVATDIGFDLTKEKAKDIIGADIAANVTYDFVTFDAYYATKAKTGETPKHDYNDPEATTASYTEHLLSAQVKTDLNSFNVPVALTVAVKDIIAKQNISLKAEVKPIEGLKVTVKGGYVIDDQFGRVGEAVNTDKHDVKGKWSTGADVEYAFDLLTVKGGFSLSQKLYNNSPVQIGASASVETTTLVPGATLKLAWAGDDLTDKVDGDHDNGNLGKVTASCKITF